MNKFVPLAAMGGLLLMLTVSWANVAGYNKELNEEYNRHLKSAENYISKEIYVDAIKEYKTALDLRPNNYEIAMKVVELYDKLDDKNNYIKACQTAITADPKQEKPYLLIADNYLSKLNYTKAYKILHEGQEAIPDSKEIAARIKQIRSQFTTLSMKYDSFDGFQISSGTKSGVARVSLDGKYGLLNSDNKLSRPCEYEDIGLAMAGLTPVKQNGEWFYVDKNGYRKLVPDQEVDELGSFSGLYAPAKIDGKWGYLDAKMKEHHFEYEYAGSFYLNSAPVKKDGKWGIIDNKFESITGFVFDDILVDAYGFCTEYGVFFAKESDGKYYLYDTAGQKLSEGFDDAKRFASKQAAAVKKGSKWGFLSRKGELVIKPTYEDANSFCLGYAPVSIKGKWGCIDETGTMMIEPQFDHLDSFFSNGYALSETDGVKQFVVVNKYE